MYQYNDFDRAFVNERVAEFRDQVERRPAFRSPSLWTITPPPSRFASLAMDFP